MKLVDLSHPWNMHTPGWVGYAGSKIYYTQTLQTNRIVSQRVETSLHVGTHLDGPMHAADGAGDMASLPLTKLVHEGVIVDVSGDVGDWDIITPKHITGGFTASNKMYDGNTSATALTRTLTGAITGDDVSLTGGAATFDSKTVGNGKTVTLAGASLTGAIRYMRPNLTRRFEEKVGKSVRDFFGEYEYRHKKSGRLVKEEIFPLHYLAFPDGCIHAENVGGDIEKVLNQRCIIGAFPWKFEGGEACPCRIICFFDVGRLQVEEVAETLTSR